MEERELVDLAQALKIADGYYTRAGEKFESVEEAIAATMFGFSRSEKEFIEICVNGPAQISYKFELSEPGGSWLGRLFKGAFRREEELRSREELARKVEQFFTTPGQELKRRLENQ